MGLRAKCLAKPISMSVNYNLQDKFLDKFFSSKFAGDFYLTGGTALARYYFNHRESVDLDLFTQNQDVDFNEVNFVVLKILDSLGLIITKQVVTETFLQYICRDSKKSPIKVDLVKDIPVHFGKILIRGKIRLDSLENIGSNKILAILGRTDAKDFVDLYFILNETKLKFDYLFNSAKKKDLGLSELYLASSMRQIEMVNIYPSMLRDLNKTDLVKFYQNLSKKLLTKIKPKE